MDEGALAKDEYHQKKIGWYNEPGEAFFALPSSESSSVNCVEGDCLSGQGTAKYADGTVEYKGGFQNGYPHGEGLVTKSSGDTMFVTHYEGLLWGPAALKLENDQFREYLFVEYQSGDLAKATNFYLPEYKVYYTGVIDDFHAFRSGTIYGNGVDAEASFSEEGEFQSAEGKLVFEEGLYYEGRIDWKDGAFTYREEGYASLHNDLEGIRIDILLRDHKPSYQQMSIWKGDTLYVGPVDENFLPHGERGRLDIDGSTVKYGNWEHGIYVGRGNTREENGLDFSRNSSAGTENRNYVINQVKARIGIDGFNKYTLYDGVPTSNSITFEANGMHHQFIGIWIINFAKGTQEVCLKPQFSGGSSGKKCYTMSVLDANQSSGIATLPYNLPSGEGTYRFDLTEGNGNDLYIIVFPR
ncbi:hypothetical protein HZ996_05815 [Cryomorphaceae bacterium]|nr:hypothetical protein HZ996_05815 [Cryomorphaceae bacterium]